MERSIAELAVAYKADPSSLKPSELLALRRALSKSRAPGYEAHKDRARARDAALSASGRNIGEIPAPADPDRRAAAVAVFRVFCESYFRNTFTWPWSEDHLKVIAKIESAIVHGGLFAMAMPRGSGKTSLCETGAIWALLTGRRRFVAAIGPEQSLAEESLVRVKAELETNDALAEDFPEVCFPIRCLDGIAQRAAGQLYGGKRTHIGWTGDQIVLPTIPGSAASGGIIRIAGITGRVRGMLYLAGDGTRRRPDLAIVDDPQTDESARSVSQNANRERILAGAVLGLAGPGKKIAGFMPCTVIARGDMADNILNREKHPEWQGDRMKMVYAFPTDEKLWAEYQKLRASELQSGRGIAAATAFYVAHRAAMDAGAVVAWPSRFKPDEASAIQSAMNEKFQDEAAFYAEYQNEPKEETTDTPALTTAQICAKINRLKRKTAPLNTSHVVAFVDVSQEVLWYAVCAWGDDFTGGVIDYGTWPDQAREYFTLRDATRTLGRTFPAAGVEGRVYAGLARLTGQLIDHPWTREDGAELRVEFCLIDAGWSPDVVHQFCRQSGHGALLMPSLGRGIGASGVPFADYKKHPGERIGHNWRIPSVRGTRAIRHVVFDANYWKSFVYARLAVAMGDRGCLALFGEKPALHRLFADHLTAEYAVRTSGRGREVDEWKSKPNNPDNHWLDCLVGCAVAASMRGASLDSVRSVRAIGPNTQQKRLSFSERQRAKQLRRNEAHAG